MPILQNAVRELIWSAHACVRADSRFGKENIEVPTEMLLWLASNRQPGQNFRFRVGDVVFQCARDRDTAVIKTVHTHAFKNKAKRKRSQFENEDDQYGYT